MRPNRELALAVKRALATGTIALCGAGAVAAYAQQATTAQPGTNQVSAAKTTTAKTTAVKATAAKATSAKAPILLAQATTVPAPAPAFSPVQLQTVVVTGTMIPRTEAETTEAITIIQSDTLKDMGVVNVEQSVDDIVANMPSNVNTAQSVSTFSGAASFANLRDLGAGRTLVLVDGQRLADNVVYGDAVDLNGIPFSAIQSVQVLREGASALYGSDAIAGVINFITKKDYQGGEVNVDFDRPQENGGASGEADATWGHGSLEDNGYNLLVTGSYQQQNELQAGQRSFSATGYAPALGLVNLNGPTATWPGSYTTTNQNSPDYQDEWQVGYPQCTGNPQLIETAGQCEYKYSAVVDDLPKQTTESGMVQLIKSLPANNSVTVQYIYTQDKVTVWSGPQSFSFEMTPQADPTYFPTAAESSCSGTCAVASPDLTDPIIAGWTDPDNNRYNADINTEQRVVLTFAGNNGGWDYAANFNYSVNKNNEDTVGGYANYDVLAPNGILSNLINPFGAQTAAGNALINSSYLNGTYANGKLQYYDIDGHASHELGDAFNSGSPATLALGFSAEYNDINFASTPLANTLYAALYYPPTNVVGSYSNEAIFSELDVPISKSVEVDLSDREDRYSDFGNTNNGKIAVRYAPSQYVTLRGTASTGFRAPSLVDLYAPNTFGATGGTIGDSNPACQAGSFNAEFSQLVCSSQGLGLYGGNRNLQPETSENFDFGIVLAPLTNLGITLDYYRILVKNALGTVPDTAIYGNPTAFANDYILNSSGTLTPAPESNTQCSPSYTAGTCGYILQTTVNTGGITTDGFDLSTKYIKRTAIGTFNVDLEGTMITHFRLQEYNGAPQLDLVSWFNSGNEPAIHWQHLLTVGWTSPSRLWGAGVDNRFFSSYIDEFENAEGQQIRVGSQSTWDVYGSYKPIQPLTVVLGINNVLNKYPPFSNQTYNWPAGYNPVYSSPLLREFYLNLKYDF